MKAKYVFWGIGGLVTFIVLAFVLELGGLQWTKFFSPRHQNVERQVFEQTQSYTHGKTQDLARLFEQYQQAETEDKKLAIKELVKMQFSEFDSNTLNNNTLRNFLLEMRGF